MKLTLGTIVTHPSYGEGVVFAADEERYRIYFQEHGEKQLALAYDGFEIVEAGESSSNGLALEDVVAAVENVFEQYMDHHDVIELGDKWEGGTLVLQPEDSSMASKEIPIETFFHKIVMVRDRLRVLEQNINAHKKLSDEDKVNLQQYITRIYGSLTTFNVLFAQKSDQFVGEKKQR